MVAVSINASGILKNSPEEREVSGLKRTFDCGKRPSCQSWHELCVRVKPANRDAPLVGKSKIRSRRIQDFIAMKRCALTFR